MPLGINPLADVYPIASAQDVAGFGLGGADYGNYQPTDFANKVAGATGKPNLGAMMLAKALGGMGGSGGSMPVSHESQIGSADYNIAPSSLNTVQDNPTLRQLLAQALMNGGSNG